MTKVGKTFPQSHTPFPQKKKRKKERKGQQGNTFIFTSRKGFFSTPTRSLLLFLSRGARFFNPASSFSKNGEENPPSSSHPPIRTVEKVGPRSWETAPPLSLPPLCLKHRIPYRRSHWLRPLATPRPRGWGLLVVNGLRKRKKSLLIPTTPVQGAGEEEEAAAAAEMQISDIYIYV